MTFLCPTHGQQTGVWCPACDAIKAQTHRPSAGLEQTPEDARMDNIIRNGNDGAVYAALSEHYELSRPATPANYLTLQAVLDEAFNQAAYGKGAERHAQSKPFEEQPMQKLIELYGIGFALGQAGKKMQEAQRMDVEPAVRELLGAINYIAGVVVHLEKAHG